MKKTVLSLFFSLIFPISITLANNPPSQDALFPIQSVSLSYDLKTSVLHVDAVHPSDNWERDYVRMMTVSLNGQLVSTLNYYHQTKPSGFSDDVSLNAKPGDVITVHVFCTQGNSISQDLTVASQPGQGADAGTNNNTTDSTTNSTADNTAN